MRDIQDMLNKVTHEIISQYTANTACVQVIMEETIKIRYLLMKLYEMKLYEKILEEQVMSNNNFSTNDTWIRTGQGTEIFTQMIISICKSPFYLIRWIYRKLRS